MVREIWRDFNDIDCGESVMNVIYFESLLGEELSVKSVEMKNNVVLSVIDVEGVVYKAEDIRVFTPSDFIYVEDIGRKLYPGLKVHLSRMDLRPWVIRRGWYSVGGNPAIFGWYLESIPAGSVRSLQCRDLDEVEIIKE